MVQLLHLLCRLVVELDDLAHELSIGLAQLLTVLDIVQDGAGLTLNLVDVEVVRASNRVALLLLLRPLLSLLHFALTGQLLGKSLLGSDAVVEVAALLLPELFQLLAGQFGEGELLAADLNILQGRQFAILLFINTIAGNGELALILVGTAIHDLELVEISLDHGLEVLPVDLVLGISLLILVLGNKVQDERVFKIARVKNNSTLLITNNRLRLLGRLFFLLLLRSSLALTLPQVHLALRQGLVGGTTDLGFIGRNLEIFRVCASFSNDASVLNALLLDLVAVQEVGQGDVAVLVGRDLFAEEVVTFQVLVSEVVLDLFLECVALHVDGVY